MRRRAAGARAAGSRPERRVGGRGGSGSEAAGERAKRASVLAVGDALGRRATPCARRVLALHLCESCEDLPGSWGAP